MRIPELKLFAMSMKDMNCLIDLTLQGNFIDEEMIKWLVSGLISNQSIIFLNLANNQINDQG
jgi:hypothetical protein